MASLGFGMAAVVYPFIALAVTGSVVKAAVVLFAGMITGALLRLPGGVLADRWPRKRLMVWSEVTRAAVTTSLIIAILADRVTLAHLVATTVVTAACAACFEPAQTIAIRHVVPTAQLPHALAQNEGRRHLARLGGQPLGGYLYGLGQAVPVVAHALSYLASAVTIGLIRRPLSDPDRRPSSDPMWRDVATGLRYVWDQRFLRVSLLCAAGFQFVFAGLGFVVIASAAETGTSAGQVGAAFAAAGGGGMLGAMAAPRLQRWLSPAVLVYSFGWTSAVCLALMGWYANIYVIGGLLALAYFVATPANAMISAAQIDVTPAHLQGRVISAAMLVAGIAAPVSPLAAGALFERAGRAATFLGFVAVSVALTIVMHLSQQIRHMRRPETSGQ